MPDKDYGMEPESWCDKHGLPHDVPFLCGTVNCFDDGTAEFYIRFDTLSTKHYPVIDEKLMAEWLRLTHEIWMSE